MRIEGASALIVGGASGLGEATARHLHGAGAAVVIADVNADRGTTLADELGERARFVRTDVTDGDQVEAAVAVAAELEGGLRISVCCAGVGWAEKTAGKRGPHAVEPFHTVVCVNLLGSFHVLRAAAAAMLANEPDPGGERGVIVMTASIAAYDVKIGQIAYAASKGGVVGMPLLAGLPTEAREALGAQVPHPARLGHPGEYAALAAHMVENTMLNGEVVRLDGALRMPPR